MSTLEHFFKLTSDAGSSSSAAVPVFAFLAAQREAEKVASAGVRRRSYATISGGGVEGKSSQICSEEWCQRVAKAF